jgi:hypothetical protein
MKNRQFDDTIRRIGESRRGVLMGTAGAALAGALAVLPGRSIEAAKKKKKKKKPAPAPKSAYTCTPSDADDLVEATTLSRYAQSFTATRGGTLREIRVLINKALDAKDYEVQLVRMSGNVPSNGAFDVIAAAVIPDADVPTGNATLTAKFAATTLAEGTKYAVVVSRFGAEMAIPVPFSGNPCEGEMALATAGDAFVILDPPRDMTVTVLVS